jgi:hypothetical protein
VHFDKSDIAFLHEVFDNVAVASYKTINFDETSGGY